MTAWYGFSHCVSLILIATGLERSPGAKAYLSSKTVCLHLIDSVLTKIIKLDKVKHGHSDLDAWLVHLEFLHALLHVQVSVDSRNQEVRNPVGVISLDFTESWSVCL